MIRQHIIYHGRVQGVGFRYYSYYKAISLGLTGWVQNLDDGTVEMEIQGKEYQISELIAFLSNQRFIEIEDMDVKNIPTLEEREFYKK